MACAEESGALAAVAVSSVCVAYLAVVRVVSQALGVVFVALEVVRQVWHSRRLGRGREVGAVQAPSVHFPLVAVCWEEVVYPTLLPVLENPG